MLNYRIIGESSNTSRRPRLQNNGITSTLSVVDSSLPPAYSTAVLISSPPVASSSSSSNNNESSAEQTSTMITSSCNEIGPRVLYNSHTNRSHTLDNHHHHHHQRQQSPPEFRQTPTLPPPRNALTLVQRAQTLTANDVAQLLRPTKKRTQFQRASSLGGCVDQSSTSIASIRNSLQKTWSRSVEELIINAVPPGQCSAICLTGDNEINDKNDEDDVVDTKSSEI